MTTDLLVTTRETTVTVNDRQLVELAYVVNGGRNEYRTTLDATGEVLTVYADSEQEALALLPPVCRIVNVTRLAQLAREAHALSERLCSLDEQAHAAGDDKRRTRLSLAWYRNCHRMWRRLDALKRIGHTGPLW